MKETRFFYAPDAATNPELPADEAAHCVRVLRLQPGDGILLTDGKGHLYQAEITTATAKRCLFRVLQESTPPKEWSGQLHLAMAPTKNMDRIEWMAEKATEIGFDELTFLDCRFSERKVVKTERIEKIMVSAMKQSHKATLPRLNGLTDFRHFVEQCTTGARYIAHCYDEADVSGNDCVDGQKYMGRGYPFLGDVLSADEDALVLIGPEGDFSIDEVRLAMAHGFRPISLGRSRLRTETAALVAVHLMHISHAL